MNPQQTIARYPLSPVQQGMLYHSRYAPGSGVDIVQLVMTLREPLEPLAFRRAWARLLARHAVLRTSIQWPAAGQPQQVVHQAASPPWQAQDWRSLAPAAQETRLAAYLQADRRQDFDLGQAPLLRLAVFRLGDAQVQVVWSFHHLLLDGRAFPVLIKELFALYGAICQDQTIQLPAPPPYRAYIDWLQSQDPTRNERYWRKLLHGLPAPTPLGIDRPPAGDQPGPELDYGRQQQRLAKAATTALRRLAKQQQLSLTTLLHGAWALILSRYSGETDVLFGVTKSSRQAPVPGAGQMVGLLLNTLPLRVQVAPDTRLEAWLGQIRGQWLALRQEGREHTPLAAIQAWSDIAADQPLFESVLVFDHASLNACLQAEGGVWARRTFEVIDQTNYPLTITACLDGETLLIQAGYQRRRLADAAISRLLGHLARVLEEIAGNIDQRLADIAWLTPAEQQQLAVWNQTAIDYPPDRCLHHFFEAQVARTPQALAVRFEDETLTYAALEARSNRLAHFLQQQGVGPETLVGVCLERSLDMVIALYAILKAGGAYVPLDPDYPAERLAFMTGDTGVPLILTHQHLAGRLSPLSNQTVVCLDSQRELIARQPDRRPSSPVAAHNLAYVIYTSGSTGRPKGVMNTHRGIVNRLLWMQDTFELDATDRVLQKTPYSFDVSVWEFFWPLMTGAGLVVARPHGHKDNGYLVELIAARQITTLHFVPAMLQLFIDQPDVARCERLKRVICSGEALPYPLQERFFARLPAVELHNLYGPTEAAVDVSHWPCQPNSKQRLVPIGKPIANTQIYILDRSLKAVPVGVAGELHIGGVQVARGYLNRPELTREKFIPDPFCDTAGARLYKSGDLARYLPDGNIEYLGRLDHQIKIRGFRIELGEIEAVLNQHPAVRESVVLAQERAAGQPGEKSLVAYVVPVQTQAAPGAALRRYLRKKLPDYMVPALFVSLEQLPLTANGKVNRRALPPPSQTGRPALETVFVAPRSPLERRLANLWQALLAVDSIGIHDNFFELGGDSLTGAAFINRLQTVLDETLYVAALFEAPTVAQFCEYLADHYPAALARLDVSTPEEPGQQAGRPAEQAGRSSSGPISGMVPDIEPYLRRAVLPGAAVESPAVKNPPAIFILAPPRSGSTLLRVMLAGHSSLFAPPEMELLAFSTLGKRQAAFSGPDSFRQEGLLRAVMAIKACNADQARDLVESLVRQNLTIQQMYRRLQAWIAPKTLVDKSPTYALSLETLQRAERYFERPLYIHLCRHPLGMVRSFEQVRLDRLLFQNNPPFTGKALAEAIWLRCHQNIVEFLRDVPAQRQYQLRFEALVSTPNPVLMSLCHFLGVPFQPDVCRPYQEPQTRMTDGLRPGIPSRMLGDVKFHEHTGINPDVATAWQTAGTANDLSPATWQLAETLGYARPQTAVRPGPGVETGASSPNVPPVPADISAEQAAVWLADLEQLSDETVEALLKAMQEK